jgi:hypothetical protein
LKEVRVLDNDIAATTRWLRDRIEIFELFVRYCDALDHCEWALLDDVFTDDVTSTWATGTVAVGRADTVDYITRHWVGLGRTHHIIGNFAVDMADDVANARVRLRSHHVGAGSRSDLFEESLCALIARAVRTSAGWRFYQFEQDIYVMLGTTDVFTMYSEPDHPVS